MTTTKVRGKRSQERLLKAREVVVDVVVAVAEVASSNAEVLVVHVAVGAAVRATRTTRGTWQPRSKLD